MFLFKDGFIWFLLSLSLFLNSFYAIRDVGLMKHWDNSMIKPNKCTANSPHRERKIPRLTVSDLLGTFVLWIFGIALSIVIFLLELVFHVIFRWQAMWYFFCDWSLGHRTSNTVIIETLKLITLLDSRSKKTKLPS